MRISGLVIDSLGIKLYDKVSAVMAELIANAYDADASEVSISLPLGIQLATKDGEQKCNEIIIQDNGIGMTPEELQNYYLLVGRPRRSDSRPGAGSHSPGGRPVMGRKGIGKLAPFGICKQIEITSSGGEKTENGYLTSHIVLDYDEIVKHFELKEGAYSPKKGSKDGSYQEIRGTTIKLSVFYARRIPSKKTFHDQLSRRFGIENREWTIKITDTTNSDSFNVGNFEIELMEGTKREFSDETIALENGKTYQISGWIGYSKVPYRDEEMAGIRIYVRGKLAATTKDFEVQSGFTGESTLRSYLVGQLHADWLDDDQDEDNVRSDRQDILWNTDKGDALKKWGQTKIKEVAKNASENGLKTRVFQEFLEKTQLEETAKQRFGIRSGMVGDVVKLAKIFASGLNPDTLKDEAQINRIKEFALSVAPHKTIVDSLREIAEEQDDPLKAILGLFPKIHLAEKASLGQIAKERIDALRQLKDNLKPEVPESKLQTIVEAATWLVNPEWTVISANETIKTFKENFIKWYGEQLAATPGKYETKRPDFTFISYDGYMLAVEIKSYSHILTDEEFKRILNYRLALNQFYSDNKKQFSSSFSKGVKIILICDDIKLVESGNQLAYSKLEDSNQLERFNWIHILDKTKKVHESFLKAAQVDL